MKNKLLIAFTALFFFSGQLFAADIIAAPNPWVPEGGKARTGTLAGGITFKNLPDEGELFIYTLSGNLVLKKALSDAVAGVLNWDGKNESEVYVASGVYFWVAKSPAATKTGKLVIVR